MSHLNEEKVVPDSPVISHRRRPPRTSRYQTEHDIITVYDPPNPLNPLRYLHPPIDPPTPYAVPQYKQSLTMTTPNPTLTPLTQPQLTAACDAALVHQAQAQDLHKKRPFAAILLAPDNETILLSSNSLSHVRHAESELARNAADNYDWAYLALCTLVSTWEPCAMCAGAIYWAHIGRLVYMASEKALQEVIGAGNPENLTLDLPCRRVFEKGQSVVEVIGPLVDEGWERRVVEDSRRYWG
jgi:tRNA(Arg) A34 adenosine deaminase TadA